jgi:dihydroorotase
MGNFHIFNARIVNENETFPGSILIEGNRISKISRVKIMSDPEYMQIDAKNGYLIPGIIDDQVHFREPGLTHKADIASESKAALAGGITSFMEMPNTSPQTVTINELEKKFDLAATKSYANYSFYLGATNDNINEIKLLEPSRVCGVKIFMGASTGNMLVDKIKSLEAIFSESPVLVATHCEDESIIQANLDHFRRLHGDDIPINLHPKIRSAEACYKSS